MKSGMRIAQEIIEQRERVKQLRTDNLAVRAGGLHPVAAQVLDNARAAAQDELNYLERAEYDFAGQDEDPEEELR